MYDWHGLAYRRNLYSGSFSAHPFSDPLSSQSLLDEDMSFVFEAAMFNS